jgi:hypothetical protein
MTSQIFTKKIQLLREQEIGRKNSVGHADSVEKILGQISLMSPEPLTYEARTKTGRPRIVSLNTPVREVLITPSLFRKFICTVGCTACCQKFTLDYIPSEFIHVEHQEGFEEREVWVNGKRKIIYTNDQNANPICDFLTAIRRESGQEALGCANYQHAPLSCISAPQLQFIQMRPERTYVLKKPFGRAWAMTPTPQCQFIEMDMQNLEPEIEMMSGILNRFAEWGRYFGIKNVARIVKKEIAYLQRTGLMPTQAYSVWKAQ